MLYMYASLDLYFLYTSKKKDVKLINASLSTHLVVTDLNQYTKKSF